MAADPTMRDDWVEKRLMGWLTDPARSLSGVAVGAIQHVDVPRSAALPASPWIRCTFAPQEPEWMGKASATQTALAMTVLLVCDLFWPAGDDGQTINLQGPQQTAAELRDQLAYLNLPFWDYTVPAAPTVVANAALYVRRPPAVQRLSTTDGYRRWQVRALVEWVGRTADRFA